MNWKGKEVDCMPGADFFSWGVQQICLNSLDPTVHFDLFLEARWQASQIVRIISTNTYFLKACSLNITGIQGMLYLARTSGI